MEGSLLHAVGLPELVTHSTEAYEALAIDLAESPKRLQTLRERLIENRRTAPLFSTDRFTRNLEAAFAHMWERHCRGEMPESFAPAINST
jgi:predicted O-linked N-acetylglucosamine transferase (SPINDLY family)